MFWFKRSATFSRILGILEIGFLIRSTTLEILEVLVPNILQNPGNLGNLTFSNLSVSWKYYHIPKPIPNRVIPGNAGGPAPKSSPYGRDPGTQTHWGLRPPDPRSGFFGAVRGPASYVFTGVCYYSSSSVIPY